MVDLQQQKETVREELRRAKKEIQTKTLERENTALHREVADHEETIEALQDRMQTIQADHSREIREMQQKHINELAQTETNLKREISRLTVLLNKTLRWFPQIKDIINLEKLCLAVGFNKEQTATLLTGNSIEYSGELYSKEYERKFMAENVKAKVFFILTVDLRPIKEWFKEQFEKLRQTIRQPIIPQRKDRGFKL